MTLGNSLKRSIAAGAVVVAATLLSRLIHANAVTAGFIYLTAVLGLAIWQGFLAGTIGSLLATACFNFFFFPPIGTFRIADPENWVALGCFLMATTVASRLVVREKERAAEAESRQREIEALYNLCVDLFTASATPGGLNAATGRALRTIGAQSGGLVLPHEGQADSDAGSWVGAASDLETHKLLGGAPAVELSSGQGSSGTWRNVRIPVLVGGRPSGVLVAYGTRANQGTLESIAKLVALAVERERLLTEQARLEALQASDSFKTSLLRAVSHDLTTPLTAIMLSLETLKRHLMGDPDGCEIVGIIAEQTARLQRRIQNLLAMARLEAGSFVLRREPTPPADLFRAARENLQSIASSRRIEAHVAPDCPDMDVDPSLALEILVNLIENAHRASPPSSPIELVARPHPAGRSRVRLEVLDRGGGLPTAGPRLGGPTRAFPEGTAGDVERRGLGLEIAKSFAAAHDGKIALLPREGGGVCAQVDLPAADIVVAEAP